MSLMGLFDVGKSAIFASQQALDVISNNIANATTTRTPEGGPYKRKRAIFAPVNIRPSYKSPLVPKRIEHGIGKGVRVIKIEEDKAPFRPVYDPHNPDAIKIGQKRDMWRCLM